MFRDSFQMSPKARRILLCLLCMVGLCLWPATGSAQDLESLQQELWNEQKAKEKTETHIVSLTDEERSLHKELNSLERKIGELEEKEKKLQAELKSLASEQEELQSQISELRSTERTIRSEIQKLLPRLWKVTIRSDHLKSRVLESWPEADRHKVWLSEITDTARAKAKGLQEVKNDLEEKVNRLQTTRSSLEAKGEELAAMRKEMTSNKLKFLNKVHAVRKKRQAAEEELSALKKSIDELKSQLQATNKHEFSLHKGKLPWPTKGKLIVDYGTGKGKFSKGMGFATTQDSAIKAVSWGEVVYNDKLRGFGQVIIIYHGQQYYSLYAFLSHTRVRKGHEVEQGEIIGQAGYYPESNGPGLYFELRQKQTPIDPRTWLAQR